MARQEQTPDALPQHKGLAEELRVFASWMSGLRARKIEALADQVDPDVDTTAPAQPAQAAAPSEQIGSPTE